MRLIDTSAWIEWLVGSPTGKVVATLLPEQAEWLVPTMVQLELAKWTMREVGEEKSDQVIAFTQLCRIAALDTETALLAAESCRKHKLATADAIIFASARIHGATLITCDKHFDGLPDVTVIAEITP
ncbi:MAG: type II toxin-antitoxin system VapC family toxin [Devosia sp.]